MCCLAKTMQNKHWSLMMCLCFMNSEHVPFLSFERLVKCQDHCTGSRFGAQTFKEEEEKTAKTDILTRFMSKSGIGATEGHSPV